MAQGRSAPFGLLGFRRFPDSGLNHIIGETQGFDFDREFGVLQVYDSIFHMIFSDVGFGVYKLGACFAPAKKKDAMFKLSVVVGIGFVVGFVVVGHLVKAVFETPQTL